ncbi:hypothetical protein ACFO0M_17440 [Micromonospora mangrovi]|uniref:Uncharacterized protein n=2 Tax=Micromonospora TaxID=1873 RepID=A0AAU7MAW5_9ACTN
MTHQAPQVDFTVWDVDEHPPMSPLEVSTLDAGTGTPNAVGLTRGANPGEGPGVTVWSFAPQAIEQFPLWLTQHAAMAFVAPYAAAVGVTHREATDRIRLLLKEGEPTTLTVDGSPVAAVAYQLHDDWQAIASRDPAVPVTVACSGRDRPAALSTA